MKRSIGLAGRLFIAQILVVSTGGITLSVVDAAIGPGIFHEHLGRGVRVPPQVIAHVEAAYRSASAWTLTLAVLAALVAAAAVSAYIAGRIAAPVTRLAAAASEIARGHYGVRTPPARLGAEFDALAEAFNVMASRLQASETLRRQLLADLAHEIRTPVSVLDAYAEGLEDGVVEPGAATAAVLQAQTRRLHRLVDDIATVSRTDEHQLDLRPRPVAPAELVAIAVSAAAARYAAKGVTLAKEVPSELPSLVVDPERMAQVLANLLDNALRHTPAGGTVTVSAHWTNAGVTLAVADTGEGIPAAHLDRIFERFYRVDAARDRGHGGSGIGLAIVRAIVTAHGGEVSASSPGPGGGTTIVVTLPAARHGTAPS